MAERAFGSALELEPDNGQAWKGVAALLEAYGEERAEELLRAYEKLSELAAAGKPNPKPEPKPNRRTPAPSWNENVFAWSKTLPSTWSG